MWGITIFGLVVVIIVIAIVASVAATRLGRNTNPEDIREQTERELGVRETSMGEEDSPLTRPRTGA